MKQIIVVTVCVIMMIFPGIMQPQSAMAQDEKTWLLSQINGIRGNLGLHAYVWNNQLAAAAQQHSEYMASTGSISHVQSNGSSPADRAAANGYPGGWIIENIYGGSSAQASDALNFWVNSSVHYAGLTNSNTNEIGIGVAAGSSGRFYTLVFGRRSGVNPPPAQPSGDAAPAPAANTADNPRTSDNNAPAQQAYVPPPTRRPPPTHTFTPSPTIPTNTPTATWTWTPTWTPSATMTALPATSTPISLPTIVAQDMSDTSNPDENFVIDPATAVPDDNVQQAEPVEVAINATAILDNSGADVDDSGQRSTLVGTASTDDPFSLETLFPILLIGQAFLIGFGLFTFLKNKKA